MGRRGRVDPMSRRADPAAAGPAKVPSHGQAGPLPAMRPLASPRRTLHMVGNAHLDPVWLWP